MSTIEELQQLEGSVWADNISSHISNESILLWHSLEELADFVEIYVPLEDAAAIAPKAIGVLEGGREHLEAMNVPRPRAVELLLLRLERLGAGLDPDAE